ncbi:MAG: hypothetical protein ABI969_03615 [bacterium]
MVRRLILALAGFAVFSAPFATAAAQPRSSIPGLSISFVSPTGTGNTHSSFDIFLRLALDPNASAFVFDGNSPATSFGLGAANLPTTGTYFLNGQQYNGVFDPNAPNYISASTTYSLECSGSFFGGCGGSGAYNFNFSYCTDPNVGCFLGLSNFSLQPGTSFDFLFGTVSPIGGTAPAGTYSAISRGR